jgi:hypothetical protein
MQYMAHGGENQQWYFRSIGSPVVGGISYVVINACNLHALDVLSASMDDHAPIVHYHEHDGLSQRWWINELNTRSAFKNV